MTDQLRIRIERCLNLMVMGIHDIDDVRQILTDCRKMIYEHEFAEDIIGECYNELKSSDSYAVKNIKVYLEKKSRK